MERFKTFYEKKRVRRPGSYKRIGSQIDHSETAFKEWVSSKLQRPIREFIGSGAEGIVYEIDKFRVIKFACWNCGWNALAKLKDKNVDGIIKVYSMGVIHLPVRFQYDHGTSTGIYRFSECADNEIGYIIMEKVQTPASLKSRINDLYNSWHKWKRELGILGVPRITDAFVEWRENEHHLESYFEFLPKETAAVGRRILEVIRNLDDYDIIPGDFINWGNWGVDTKGKIVLFDFWDRSCGRSKYKKPKHEII